MRGNQWLRAFRSAARTPRQVRPVTPVARLFHGSSVSARSNGRRPEDDGYDGDDGRNNNKLGTASQEAGKGAGEEAKAEADADADAAGDNLLGPDAAAATGESQGRRKPTTGLRSRTLRNRKADLPPVQIPGPFLDLAINRHGDAKTSLTVEDLTGQGRENPGQDAHGNMIDLQAYGVGVRDLFDDVAWSGPTVEKAIETLNSRGDISPLMRRMDVLGDSVYWNVLHSIEMCYGEEARSGILESTPPLNSLGWAAALLKCQAEDRPTMLQSYPRLGRLLLHYAIEDGEIPLTKASFYDPCIVDEIITALRAEFFIRASRNSRLASIRRPTTIINIQDFSGFSVAQDILQYVADKLEADVLHLRAHDIAHIVGRYIGQDVPRAPGDVSLIGYKTAENCGRLRQHPAEEENEDAGSFDLPFTVMVRDEKGRKDTKRQTMSMDDFLLGSGTRGKSDELWEDMKVNAALDELLHSADIDASEQRPLIVHINDFNALNMDEIGAAILSKIRRTVDELWLSGRKIVLVGSCSTNDAPKSYQAALRTLETSERVIHLSRRHFADIRMRLHGKSTLTLWEKQDYFRENDENIVRMLWSMTDSDDSLGTHPKGTLGLERYARSGPSSNPPGQIAKYGDSVLAVTEIYRIATTMIGLSSTGVTELFSLDCFEKAVAKTSAVDEAMERAAARSTAAKNSRRGSIGDFLTGTRKTDPSAENHEEKLMSGMVNAQDMRTTFKDIHAPRETIESIKMLTTLSLVRPEAFSYGVLASDRIPGCLLYGPPGTGKTLLAKAVAKESGANMIEISGASINNMYVGESEKNVRALFRLAKKKEPMVIFIDEADALLGARGGHQNWSRRDTINQFLREWDGMDKTKAFIMVATNRPFDLDEAVLRRLPRKLLIDLPLETDRAAILRIHLKDEVLDETVSIEDMAKRTPLYSGSDLKNMCVAAAMTAVKEELEASERHTGPEPYEWAKKRVLNRHHFDEALKEIGASVSEDMATLTAIRKFDERYGDRKARKKRKGIGFEVIPEAPDSERALVRGRP